MWPHSIKFTLLFLFFVEFSKSELDLRENFGCFKVHETVENMLGSDLNEADFGREICAEGENSLFHQACKTEVRDGFLHSGCMNSTQWATNFVCSPMHRKRVYAKDMDGIGVNLYDDLKIWCCRSAYCNHANYLRLLKGMRIEVDTEIAKEWLSDGILVVSCVILITLYSLYLALTLKPIYGRIDLEDYAG